MDRTALPTSEVRALDRHHAAPAMGDRGDNHEPRRDDPTVIDEVKELTGAVRLDNSSYTTPWYTTPDMGSVRQVRSLPVRELSCLKRTR